MMCTYLCMTSSAVSAATLQVRAIFSIVQSPPVEIMLLLQQLYLALVLSCRITNVCRAGESPVAEPHMRGTIPSRCKAPDLARCSTSLTKRSGSFSGDSRTQQVRYFLPFNGCSPVSEDNKALLWVKCSQATLNLGQHVIPLHAREKHRSEKAMHFSMPCSACCYG